MKKTIVLILLAVCSILYAAGNDTFTLTSWVERRNQEPLIKPTWEFVVTGTWDATDDTDAAGTIPVNGILIMVILEIPDTKSDPACQVKIYDNGNNLIFDSGDRTAGGTCTYNLFEPFASEMNIYMGPNGAFGIGGGVITVTLRGI